MLCKVAPAIHRKFVGTFREASGKLPGKFWDSWERKPSEDRFGAHDCTTLCHSCNIGAIVDPRCDMCMCEQSLDSEQQEPTQWRRARPDLEDAVGFYKNSVQKESAVYHEAQADFEKDEKQRGYRSFPEGDMASDAIPHYDWMNGDDQTGTTGWSAYADSLAAMQ